MERWIKAGVATLVVAASAACTAAHTEDVKERAPRDAVTVERACADGTYEWFNIERPRRLTGLAAPEAERRGGGALRNPIRRLATPVTSVTADGPALSSRDVLFSLALRIGEAQPGDEPADLAFADTGRRDGYADANLTDVLGAGRFVRWTEVRAVEADFRHICHDGRTTAGHARGWTMEGEGLLDCDEPVDGPDGGAGAGASQSLAREAARLACGPAARAVRP